MAGQKRKMDYGTTSSSNTNAQARKRQKGRDARVLPTQTTDAAFSKNGELNIATFIKSREFEIAALENGMRKAKKNLSARAFQQVPRHMRRRTASHNVKKIPRRLRSRASREMLEDNTPTGAARKKSPSAKMRLRLETARQIQVLNAQRRAKRLKKCSKLEAKLNAQQPDPAKHVSLAERIPRVKKDKLVEPPKAISKFKRRQVNKTWLPTHLWHTKRAHMTKPNMPLWRFAIPVTSNEKVYRSTHRASTHRGCVAWDTSYISTFACQGTEKTLLEMLKVMGFAPASRTSVKLKRWVSGSRHASGWLHHTGNDNRPLCPAIVVWRSLEPDTPDTGDAMDIDKLADKKSRPKLNRKILMRVHPSAMQQFWHEILLAAKAQKPQVLVEDLRFEIGSVELIGPNATEALAGLIDLCDDSKDTNSLVSQLATLNDPSLLPQDALLAFNIGDPRLHFPPRQKPVQRDQKAMDYLNSIMVSWPPDKDPVISDLFDYRARYRAGNQLPSQKSIYRRRRELLPGQTLTRTDKDPPIPCLLLAHRNPKLDRAGQGSWTVLLPWGAVDAFWRSLMYYPLSCGRTPRFGCLQEARQLAFEQSVPYFPADFAGTEAGKAWERTAAEQRFDAWFRRPPSKRFSWAAVDLGMGRKGEHGRGWTCDWEYLFRDTKSPPLEVANNRPVTEPSAIHTSDTSALTQRQRKVAMQEQRASEKGAAINEDMQHDLHNDVAFSQADPSQVSSLLTYPPSAALPQDPLLACVRITMLSRGTPKEAARIYRLPSRTNVIAARITDVTPANDESTQLPALEQPTPMLMPDHSLVDDNHERSHLRDRWLNLDPEEVHKNKHSSTTLPRPIAKEHRNRYGDIAGLHVYDARHTMDVSHIRVFPPNETHPKVLNVFGPKPAPKTNEQKLKVLQPQLVPKMVLDRHGDLVEERQWDKHVPCPDAHDLIGYVTTAGYNLAQGHGTALGSLWVQRLMEGWDVTPAETTVTNGAVSIELNALGSSSNVSSKQKDKGARQLARQRHLCIVRNAGESIGRLAIWEVC